jgi:BCD family chlorophyll transporter-like MFS transporter
MTLADGGRSGIALGAWGAVQATAAGFAIAAGGIGRDLIATLATRGEFGETLAYRATGYGTIYMIEILLLLATLIALGPLVGRRERHASASPVRFGLSQFPT